MTYDMSYDLSYDLSYDSSYVLSYHMTYDLSYYMSERSYDLSYDSFYVYPTIWPMAIKMWNFRLVGRHLVFWSPNVKSDDIQANMHTYIQTDKLSSKCLIGHY